MTTQGRPQLPFGTLVAGKYSIVRPLGEGGMGAVYVVEHTITKHHRALKLLHPEMTAVRDVVDRFLREASAAGHIGSEHIVETFDAGTLENGAPYLVMELLKGETLAERIARRPPQLGELVDIMEQACSGIQAAHDAGIVHRDLKPENLFLADRQGRAFVKVLDFGISKFDPSKSGALSTTREGAALGTPYYMSPEQMLGSRAVDHRTDLYALGVILYEALTGRRPFEADALPLLAVRIHEGNAVPVAALRPDLPPAISAIVQQAMRIKPEERFQSARELAAQLAPFRGGTNAGLALDRTALSSAPPAGAGPDAAVAYTAPGVGMGTSAAGVSVRPPGGQRPRSATAIVLGLVGLVLAAGGTGVYLFKKANADDEPPMAGPVPATEHTTATAAAPPPVQAAPATVAPPPPASVSAAPPPRTDRPRTGTTPSATAAPAVPASSPPKTKAPSRAAAESLATENPFR